MATEVKLGATGKFPRGKLTHDDEGELKMGVTHTKDTVVIDFGKPVTWFGLPATMARELAGMLTKHADAIDGKETSISARVK